jgi:hypothetical protein
MDCTAAMYSGNMEDNRLRLISQKNRGGLISPSKDVISICNTTELLYRRTMDEFFEIDYQDFAQNLATAVFGRLSNSLFFPNLDSHIFDSNDNHKTLLIKTISLCYLRIRSFHETKKINNNMIGTNKRKVLTRLAILQNV